MLGRSLRRWSALPVPSEQRGQSWWCPGDNADTENPSLHGKLCWLLPVGASGTDMGRFLQLLSSSLLVSSFSPEVQGHEGNC